MNEEFDYIVIALKRKCNGYDSEFYISHNGSISYSSCGETSELDIEYDEELIHEAIEILEKSIRRVKKFYGLNRVER